MSEPTHSSPLAGKPSVAVVGVGGIGGAMAAALGDGGHEVALCVRTPFETLSRTINGEVSRYNHPVHLTPGNMEPVDWVLLCTKVYQNTAAEPWLRQLVGSHTQLAVMQNGVDHLERVAAFASAERVVPCVVRLPASVLAPGHVAQDPGTVQVPASPGGYALQALFHGQDRVTIEPTVDFVSALWKKLALNAVGGAICALAVKPLKVVAAPQVRDLALQLIEEIVAVGRAEGAQFPEGYAEGTLEIYEGRVADHWTSIAVDRREGRPMEWEARNAVVGRFGRKHGIATPANDALTAMLELIDATR